MACQVLKLKIRSKKNEKRIIVFCIVPISCFLNVVFFEVTVNPRVESSKNFKLSCLANVGGVIHNKYKVQR
jgi:hypothetical protein